MEHSSTMQHMLCLFFVSQHVEIEQEHYVTCNMIHDVKDVSTLRRNGILVLNLPAKIMESR